MTKYRVLWMLFAALVAGSCAPPAGGADLSDETRRQITLEVRDAMTGFADADRARDPESALAYLDPDFYMYADGVRASYDDVAVQVRASLPALRRFDTEWTDVEITPLSADTAFSSMTFHDEITSADGTVTEAWGPTTFVWRKRDGEWKLIYADADHYQ